MPSTGQGSDAVSGHGRRLVIKAVNWADDLSAPAPCDPAAVARLRAAVARKLSEWGLDEVASTTALILSELSTKAIRYTNSPIKLRLLRDRSLICEVSDSSTTSRHLRYAATTDEGGEGSSSSPSRWLRTWGFRSPASGVWFRRCRGVRAGVLGLLG
ncbi:hypothetical protein GCM10022206_85340 [Streptomyces chiangmaiensis]